MNDSRLRMLGFAFLFATTLTVTDGGQVSATSTPSPPGNRPAPTSLQLAQTTTLTERPDQIGTCRGTGAANLTIHENSGLTRPIGSVPASSRVTLTGVFGSGVVQIREPRLGWITASSLKLDCNNSGSSDLPSDIDTNPQYCRRVRSSKTDGIAYQDLDVGLVARNSPNGDIQYAGTSADGPSGGAYVRVTASPPELRDIGDRRWIRIKYTGLAGNTRVGWVSNGPIGVSRNIANCS